MVAKLASRRAPASELFSGWNCTPKTGRPGTCTAQGKVTECTVSAMVATLGGARALGIADKVGSLEIGKCADMIAVDLSSSHQSFTTDPVAAVVNTCTTADVLMTMVDGNVLYEKNRWHVKVEVAKSIARVIEIRSKLRPEA